MNSSTTIDLISIESIQHAIDHAVHFLPAQGPITVFIHHNTLHGFEDHSFEEGVRIAGELFGCRPFLTEERYRDEIAKGRINQHDISDALLDSLGDRADALIGFLGTRYSLRRAMLRHPLHTVLPNQLEWVMAEERSLERFSSQTTAENRQELIERTRRWVNRLFRENSDLAIKEREKLLQLCRPFVRHFSIDRIENWTAATWESFTLKVLWHLCLSEVARFPKSNSESSSGPDEPASVFRHRDHLLALTGFDSDPLVNEFLIRFCVVMLDQGLSRWQIPDRERGLFHVFKKLFMERIPIGDRWTHGLARELQRIDSANMSPLESIQESFQLMGVAAHEVDAYVLDALLSLRGFAGMVWQMEIRTDRIAHGLPQGSITEFLAIRLILCRLALRYLADEHLGGIGELAEIRRRGESHQKSDGNSQARCEAFAIFQLAQSMGWQAESLFNLTMANWKILLNEIRSFDDVERLRVLHLAYERHYRHRCLDSLLIHNRISEDETKGRGPSDSLFDVVTCIDDREESLRRHLEEVEPRCRTWGGAGFFGVAMYYRDADSFQFVPLCPIVIEPQHYVQEIVTLDQADVAERRSSLRRVLGKTQANLHASSRSLLSGALTAVLGTLMTIPLVARVLFPRLTAIFLNRVSQLHSVPSQTALHLERTTSEPGREEQQIGFSLDEMVSIVERVLRDLGITKDWSRLFVFLGHGATTRNNPHESAYDCGACGGGRGGPNARAFTQMANDPRVRIRLKNRGIDIPETTYFVGGFHNTCNDQIVLLDLGRVPASHINDIRYLQQVLLEASRRNAHERCRRFESADLNLSPRAAYDHVFSRSEDLSQVRPECGHATNAICVVGRREKTRGLFLDRRAFLHSYDPTQDDDDQSILARILAAVFPVCGGINLEYYFSHVDSEGYGCGTKLPHNITSLVGVMNGAASDLRTGLPWQMVEIHEPVRLLIVMETTPARFEGIMSRNSLIDRYVKGGWVQVATWNPDTGSIHVFHQGRFQEYQCESESLVRTNSSFDWYRGNRDHLDFAQIAESLASAIPSSTRGAK